MFPDNAKQAAIKVCFADTIVVCNQARNRMAIPRKFPPEIVNTIPIKVNETIQVICNFLWYSLIDDNIVLDGGARIVNFLHVNKIGKPLQLFLRRKKITSL